MDDKNIDILEQIHASYYHLTATERRVADYVIANHQQVQFMSITQLADECGTAEATISRFCRTMKQKGFNAFKIELAKHSVSGSKLLAETDLDTPHGRWATAANLSSDAIRQTLEFIDPKQVEQAVQMIQSASRVMCIGSGGSMIMASECAHMFSTVTGKFYAVTDSHSQLSAAATMEPDGVIFLFSYSGATNSGLQVLKLAKERKLRTILVTRFQKSPAANIADVVLRCGSNEGPFQFGSVPAKMAQLMVIDILFQEYYHLNRESCEENIQCIAAELSGKHI